MAQEAGLSDAQTARISRHQNLQSLAPYTNMTTSRRASTSDRMLNLPMPERQSVMPISTPQPSQPLPNPQPPPNPQLPQPPQPPSIYQPLQQTNLHQPSTLKRPRQITAMPILQPSSFLHLSRPSIPNQPIFTPHFHFHGNPTFHNCNFGSSSSEASAVDVPPPKRQKGVAITRWSQTLQKKDWFDLENEE